MMTSNPYESPHAEFDLRHDLDDASEQIASNSRAWALIDQYFVHIHHNGVNLLGVLLMLEIAFGGWGATEMSAWIQNRVVGGILVFTPLCFAPVFDVAWRLLRGNGGFATKLFSPFMGGCVLYIPIWAAISALVGFVVVAVWFR